MNSNIILPHNPKNNSLMIHFVYLSFSVTKVIQKNETTKGNFIFFIVFKNF